MFGRSYSEVRTTNMKTNEDTILNKLFIFRACILFFAVWVYVADFAYNL